MVVRLPNGHQLHKTIIKTHRTGSVLGIIIGGTLCMCGILLLILGLAGSINWILTVGNFTSKLVNASPGVFILVVGLVVMLRYKPRIRYEYKVIRTPTSYYEEGRGAASSPITPSRKY